MDLSIRDIFTEEEVNTIIDELEYHNNENIYRQFSTCKFYIGDTRRYYIPDEVDIFIIPLKSYDTIVGFVDCTNKVFYEVGKYSCTTSKQMTQVYNAYFNDCIYLYCDREYLPCKPW